MGDTENEVSDKEGTNPSSFRTQEAQASRVANGGAADAHANTGQQHGESPQRVGSKRSGLRRFDSMELEAGRVQGFDPHAHRSEFSWPVTLTLAYQTIGVVYGDVGTSPLYVFSSTFPGQVPSQEDILGALSLIIYTLILSPLLKYVLIVLHANDNGNGGTFALYSVIARYVNYNVTLNQAPEDAEVSFYRLPTPSTRLKGSEYLKQTFQKRSWMQNALVTIAILGTSMVIGDGVLTPSISVLSAIEGLKVNNPQISQNIIVIITVVILIGLFSIQRFGTGRVGHTFSPAVLIWFLSIGLVGIYNIAKMGSPVHKAFNPYLAFDYLIRNKKRGWVSLGGIVLCITGTEAMFADLGHFSVKAIQIAFTTLVFPCLLLAYIGQAAYLLKHPEDITNAFYNSIPKTVYWPMFVIATCAAIIASQAMISATFSVVSQAMTLSCFPRLKVVYTSAKHAGQVYIPGLNWFMMVLCVLIAAGFRDTTQIGNAYGVTVCSDMFITTNLVFIIAIMIWQVPLFIGVMAYMLIGAVELLYLSAVYYKVPRGGWVPLIFATFFFCIMFTWNYGRRVKYTYEVNNKVSLDWVLGLESNMKLQRFPGIGLVYTELAQGVPTIFPHLVSNFPSLHSIVVFVCIKNLPVPHVQDDERFLIRRIGPLHLRMFRCAVRFGYLDAADRKAQRFEQQLMKNLANFVTMEGNIHALQDTPGQGTPDIETFSNRLSGSDDSVMTEMRLARRISRNAEGDEEYDSTSELESARSVTVTFKPALIPIPTVEEELAIMDLARQAGVVYLLGRSDIKAQESSSIVRRFMINDFYHALKRNSRSSLQWLNIPTEKLLQVGMIHYI
ncbi:hypothetical protein R1sor_023581 [Riccia sorocarpa]|uniref:Potassium transporter n=1 Tax=Riccia sorocarpa TaxID=122646 RepID=A0ABD3GN18_9MARC